MLESKTLKTSVLSSMETMSISMEASVNVTPRYFKPPSTFQAPGDKPVPRFPVVEEAV